MHKTISKAYKYRVYPTAEQAALLDEWMESLRRIWNKLLAEYKAIDLAIYEELKAVDFDKARSKELYQVRKQKRKQVTQHVITEMPKTNSFWSAVPSDTRRDVYRRLDKAYAAAFRRLKKGAKFKEAGWPKFKKRGNLVSVYFRNKKIYHDEHDSRFAFVNVPKGVGALRIRTHRPLPATTTRVLSYIVSKDNLDRYWISCQLQYTVPEPKQKAEAAGIDLNVNDGNLATLSSGDVVENPRWLHTQLRKLRRLQRKLDRQRRANNPDCYDEKGRAIKGKRPTKTSKRMDETTWKIAETHDKIARRRDHFYHNITHALTERYGLIALEDISPQFMLANRFLAMRASDASWSKFKHMVTYKADEKDVSLVFVPPAYTSQMCSQCGFISKENRKTQAAFKCVECGFKENADVNAAINILRLGIEQNCASRKGDV